MSPHFVFNAMNSIQALIADEKPAIALRYTSKFSKLLRTVLENSEKNFISLEKEISSLDLYIQIEALRLNFELDYAIEVDASISPDTEVIPPMIVQPYVENSLWHGLSNKKADRRLRIRFGADEHMLTCEVEDNGVGRKKSNELRNHFTNEHNSKGQSITEKRLSLINHWGRSSVQIMDLYDGEGNASGTRVVLKLSRSGVAQRANLSKP
jgi:LytS/YehU family sensor histidine kinase